MPSPLVQMSLPLVGLRRLTEPSQWVAVAESPANSGLPQKNPDPTRPPQRPDPAAPEAASGYPALRGRANGDREDASKFVQAIVDPKFAVALTFAEQESAADTAGDAVVPTGDGGGRQMLRVQPS